MGTDHTDPSVFADLRALATAGNNAAALNADLVSKLATLDPSVNPCVSIAGRGTAGDQGGGTFVGVPVAGGPAIDSAIVFASSNALWRWKRVYTDHLSPAWFGCAGNGTTNDTAALQAALDATVTYGVPLRCDAGAVYLVRYASALYNGAALVLAAGTRLDLNGATIRLDDDQWCSVIMSPHPSGGGPDAGIEIYNGTIDGNEAGQTRVWSAGAWKRSVGGTLITYTPTVVLMSVTAPYLADLTIINAFVLGLKVQSATSPYLHNIRIDGAWGDGDNLALCTDADIDEMHSLNCRGIEHIASWGSDYGNPHVWQLTRAAIGTVRATNCKAPIKIQGDTTDLEWRNLFCVAGPLTCLPDDDGNYTNWWGIKIQGTGPTPHTKRVHIGSIICDASDPAIDFATQAIGSGVYLYGSDDARIDNLTCLRCGRGYRNPGSDTKDFNDLRVLNSPRASIGQMLSREGTGATVTMQESAGAGESTGTLSIGHLEVQDPQWAFLPGSTSGPFLLHPLDGGHLKIGQIRLVESVTPPFPTRYLYGRDMPTDGSCSVDIGEIVPPGPMTDGLFINDLDTDAPRVTVGRIVVDGLIGRDSGVATLTNGATQTVVAGEGITSFDSLFPLIAVQPANVSAGALGGGLLAIPNGAPLTGMTLRHPTAGASDVVSWRGLGYASLAALNIPREWSALTIASHPDARYLAAAVFVPTVGTLGSTYMFGGKLGDESKLNELWRFDHALRTWTELTPATDPGARFRHAMAYDSARDRIVVFGGYDAADAALADTWEYYISDANWHAVTPTTSPPAQIFVGNSGMAYDSARGVCVIYGPYGTGHFWEYDCTTQDWSDEGNTLGNGVTGYVSLCYDPIRAVTVIVSGFAAGSWMPDSCYEWDGNAATLRTGLAGFGAGGGGDLFLVYDSLRERMIAGCSGGAPGAPWNPSYTWERVIATWGNTYPTLSAGRMNAAAVYAPTMAEVMAFGGTTDAAGSGVLDETVVYRR